jgi:hypothetical protein
VLLAVAIASALGLSVLLTLLSFGVLSRAFDRARHFVSLRFGETAMLLVVILFAVAGASLEFTGWGVALGTGFAIVAARFVGKAAALLLLARPSALSVRKASLVNLGLMPMSGVALLMLQDLLRFDPKLAAELSASLMLAITILAFLGPLATEFALRRGGEAGEGR